MQGESTPLSLFKSTSDINLAEQFAEFFIKKVASIHEGLTESNVNLHCNPSSAKVPEVSLSSTLPEFKPLSSGDIEEIIKSLPSKSCSLDPMQTISPLFSVTITEPFISKVIVAQQLNDHLLANALREIYQSSYKHLHSTEAHF